MTFDRLEKLLPLLRCPISKAALRIVGLEESPSLVRHATKEVSDDVTGFLAADNGAVLYPIKGQIIDLRVENVIASDLELSSLDESSETCAAKDNVRDWYDSFGWQRNEHGMLNDTAFYSEDGTTTYGLYETLSHFALIERFYRGRFLLDAASGAVAHPEYLAYSYNHKYRVCVDFSEAALQEAKQKLGEHGFCVLADVCQLPFADDAFDGIVSGYTIQHIHRDQQQAALKELYRVLRPGYRLCVMATQDVGMLHGMAVRIGKLISKAVGLFRRELEPLGRTTPSSTPPHQLYGHVWNYPWWRRVSRQLSPQGKVDCLRMFSNQEFGDIVQTRCGVRRLRALEMMFPQLLARASSLIVADIAKPVADDFAHAATNEINP